MGETVESATAFDAPIGDWDVSSVTDMPSISASPPRFNAPIRHWDVSSVKNMTFVLCGATSFNQQLGGQKGGTSTADLYNMFYNGCPGSIEGKANGANGTPV